MDYWEQLDGFDNPYARLAWLISWCITFQVQEADELVKEVKKYSFPSSGFVDWEEQVRNYCELATPSNLISLITRMPDWLLHELVRERFGGNPKRIAEISSEYLPVWLARELGFQTPPEIRKGLQFHILRLEQTKAKLAKSQIDRVELLGCGTNAFNIVETLLMEMTSFYGRCLYGEDYVKTIISDLKLHKDAEPRGWKLRKWRDEGYRLGLGVLIPLFEKLDDFLLDSPNTKPGRQCRTLFQRDTIIPRPTGDDEPHPLELLRKVNKKRPNYIHKDKAITTTSQMKIETRGLIETLLKFASLMADRVFPQVIVMQRHMTLGGGEVRIDYVDEHHTLQYVRFRRGPVPFYPRTLIYYYQPCTQEERDAVVLDSSPIFFPVDETWEGELL